MKTAWISLALALAACSGRAPAHRTAEPAPARAVTTEAPPAPAEAAPIADQATDELAPSIYDLPMKLVDAHGRSIGLDAARGKPVLVSMFYASCSVACPLLVSEVDQVLAELPESARRDVQVLLVSFDAERDTPAKLTSLARERKLDTARWTLAAARDADARALAAVLGIKYRKLANGDFAHGSTIVALDREGHPIARADALGQRAPLVDALTEPALSR